MSQRDDDITLRQVRDAARKVLTLASGRSRPDLDSDGVATLAMMQLLQTGTTLVLEVKGQDSPQNQAKRAALDQWTRAVTEHGGFGRWTWKVSRQPGDLLDLVAAAARADEVTTRA